MVQTRLPGRSLAELLPALLPIDVATILEQVGTLLRRVHAVRVDGFYRRLDDGSWDFQSYERLLEVTLRERSAKRPLLREAGFLDDEIDCMLAIVRADGEQFPCHQPVLLHGDFHPAHILVDAVTNVSGLIDFGEFQGGSPLVDLATWDLAASNLDLAPLLRGYGDPTFFGADFAQRLAATKIGLGMGYLAYHVRTGHDEEASLIAEELRRTLSAVARR